ncbi:28S ribosomal protein S35, mitochondrial-like [Coregonus clupeaformis]|uniref:28S ribosomal protein S35, mitochondrial-like n=1 Tax=Coregonus clupeaformis TaxID=59861 RepID=UPI001BE0F3A6|nr:28S ribosomal protein S35, mitochondrial-like [Coregonus clupeaformis]
MLAKETGLHTRRPCLPIILVRIKAFLTEATEDQGERTDRMPVDQDWTAVYPTAAPFRQGSVPLPVRIGFPVKRGVPPEKKGNLELVKIPNFLHLTPAAIKKHSEAVLAVFCTEWPSALDTDAKCDEHFPVKVKSKDYVSAGTSLRNPSARIVHLRVKLSSLNLDDHARKKMVKLVEERYCKETDTLTITTDSCPVRQQNYDYTMYLLTVLYHESWKVEAWESEKTVADMEECSWENSPSQKNALSTLVRVWAAGEAVREELLGRPEVQEYRDSVTTLKNEGESEGSVLQYREAVKKLLNL